MHHNPRRQLLAGLALAFGGIAPRMALAADPVYPTKPVTIVVPFPPGGPSDAIVRASAEQLGLPVNTYRHHLARGTDRVVQALWQRELQSLLFAAP